MPVKPKLSYDSANETKLKYNIMNFGSWGNQCKKWCKLLCYFSFWLNDVNFRVTSDI